MIDRVEDNPIPAEEVYLGLVKVFQKLLLITKDTKDKIPNNYSFVIPDPNSFLNILKTNISKYLNKKQY